MPSADILGRYGSTMLEEMSEPPAIAGRQKMYTIANVIG
jgi:hypothetical protein